MECVVFGDAALAVGEPIETKGYSMKQIDELTTRMSEAIGRLYYEHTYLERPDHPVLESVSVTAEETL